MAKTLGYYRVQYQGRWCKRWSKKIFAATSSEAEDLFEQNNPDLKALDTEFVGKDEKRYYKAPDSDQW